MKHTFTLIELLMAIGIIVILAAIAIPTTLSAIKKAEVAKAQSEMTALVDALKNYENTYGILPLKCVDSKDDVLSKKAESGANKGNLDTSNTGMSEEYETLIRILQGGVGKNGDPIYVDGKKMNPRKIAFLDVQGNLPGVFVDPWGEEYKIALDGDGDGKITSKDNFKGAPGLQWDEVKVGSATEYGLHTSILVWSKGPDQVSDPNSSKQTASADDKNADNVYSIPVSFVKGAGIWIPAN